MNPAIFICALATLCASSAPAQQVDPSVGSIVETVQKLRPGQYVWAPDIAPRGPTLLVVNVKTQRAILYRNGVPIGASTVSTGRPGYRTPTGVFTILEKHVEHYSSKYDSAPMPYMQRLTWYGIALHAGHLPGYPASHGCIRLPHGFAKQLYGATQLGMTVAITDGPTVPRIAQPPTFEQDGMIVPTVPGSDFEWHPERSPSGPVSVIVSVIDKRAIVMRNGVEIGSAAVAVDGAVHGTWAYGLRSMNGEGQQWYRIPLSRDGAKTEPVAREEWQRFRAPEGFKRAVASITEPGTTIVVTADSLKQGSSGAALTVIETEPEGR